VALRASLNSGGVQLAGNASDVDSTAVGRYVVGFQRDVSGCTPTATLARNAGGTVENPAPGSTIVVAIANRKVTVLTYDPAGTPSRLPFNLLVAC
jgi:hypothetical protein